MIGTLVLRCKRRKSVRPLKARLGPAVTEGGGCAEDLPRGGSVPLFLFSEGFSMRFRRSSPFTPDRVRPTKTTYLRIEVLEDRLPPGDLGFVGALMLADIGNTEQEGDVRNLPTVTHLVSSESGSRSSSQIDLLNTVTALPTEYGPAVSAPSPVVESQYLVQDEGVPQLDALAGAITLDETLGGRGPGLLVAPNTRVNSRVTCPGGTNGR